MRSKEIKIVILLLLIAGAGLFFYRAFVLGFPLQPNKSVQSWYVEAKLTFSGQNKPARIEMFLPRTSDRYTIVDENFVSDGFGLTTAEDPETLNRLSTWTKRKPHKREILYYRGILYETRAASSTAAEKNFSFAVPQYGSAEFTALSEGQAEYFALGDVIERIRQRSADDESFATELFQFLNQDSGDSRLVQLREQNEALEKLPAMAVYILQHAGIPARIMNGISLGQAERNINPESWAEVYLGDKWQAYNAAEKTFHEPVDRLRWWAGDLPLYTLENGRSPTLALSVKKHTENAVTEAMWRGDPTREAIYKMSVFNLPVDVQLVFSVLLLVPLGALVVCFMRQVIGIQTFGTFMPILVALAFRETQLLWGIVLFSTIVGLGLIFRGYMDRLQLLMVPRLSAIMTLVVIFIYLISITTFNLNTHSGLSISLFPLVILTMLIERMSITWEEFGAGTAMKSVLGSMIVAVIGYIVMNNPQISHLIITFPELLLVVLALTIMIGRYNGYKLTEYYRFRILTRPLQ